MVDKIIRRILAQSGSTDLLDFLASQLRPRDLQSLLLAVFRSRASSLTPSQILAQYATNRFVRPGQVPQEIRVALDSLALSLASPRFEGVDLAPVCPFGTSAVLGPLSQDRVVTTIRNTEVVSDSTTVLALEVAIRRRDTFSEPQGVNTVIRLCTSHRLLRAEYWPDYRANFQVFTLCTAGRTRGSDSFETEALIEHISYYLALLAAVPEIGYPVTEVRVGLTDLTDGIHQRQLEEFVFAPLVVQFPQVSWTWEPDRREGRSYYDQVCFHIYARNIFGEEYELGDGGFTPWTQQLLNNRKERLLISGIATERILTLFSPAGGGLGSEGRTRGIVPNGREGAVRHSDRP